MGQRIAKERQSAQDDEDADRAADHPDEDDGDEGMLHKGVLPGIQEPGRHRATASGMCDASGDRSTMTWPPNVRCRES